MNDDLISRKAAIDALAKFVPYAICDASTESYTNGLTDAYNLICQLPSAQPEINCSEIPNSSDFVSRKAVREMVATWAYDLMEQEDLNMALHDVDELPPVSVEREGGKKNEGHF